MMRRLRRFLTHLSPEWRRCVRIAQNLNDCATPDLYLHFTPGQVQTMRKASRRWGEDWL